jgi:hypothetical protein
MLETSTHQTPVRFRLDRKLAAKSSGTSTAQCPEPQIRPQTKTTSAGYVRQVYYGIRASTIADGRIESNHMPAKLTKEIIEAAIAGFEAQKHRIDSQIAELRGLLDGNRPETDATSEPARRRRRKMSREARARIAAAQRLRWSKARGEAKTAQPAATPEAPKSKRKLSAAGRRAIIAATKARWARVRAEKAQAARKRIARKTTAKKAAVKKTATSPTTAQAAS